MKKQPKRIAVLGSSKCVAPGQVYGWAYKVGQMIAQGGNIVINGGAGGVAEASAEGSGRFSGRSEGCLVDVRGANLFVTDVRSARDMLSVRCPSPQLTDGVRRGWLMSADGFVAIFGNQSLGTAIEILLFVHLWKARMMEGKRLAILCHQLEQLGLLKILESVWVSNRVGDDGCLADLPIFLTDSPKKAVKFVTADPPA